MLLSDASLVPGGSFFSFLLVFFFWQLSSYHPELLKQGRITSVCSSGSHATSPSHVPSFSAVCLNEDGWNATVSHSKVSFRAHHSRLHSHTNPHVFSRQKRSGQTSFHLFLFIQPDIMKSGSPVSLDASPGLEALSSCVCGVFLCGVFSPSAQVCLEAMRKRCDEVGGGAAAGALDRLYTHFKVPFGHVEARRRSHLLR